MMPFFRSMSSFFIGLIAMVSIAGAEGGNPTASQATELSKKLQRLDSMIDRDSRLVEIRPGIRTLISYADKISAAANHNQNFQQTLGFLKRKFEQVREDFHAKYDPRYDKGILDDWYTMVF